MKARNAVLGTVIERLCRLCSVVLLAAGMAHGELPDDAWGIGGAGWDDLTSMEPTSDGGWILWGYTRSFGARNEDLWVVKLKSDGQVQWQKRYGGNKWDYAWGRRSVREAPDEGFLIVGETSSFGAGNSDGWMLRLDSSGEIVWQKTLGGPGWDDFSGVDINSDGTWIITGGTALFGGWDIWLVKVDDTGRVLWQQAYKVGGFDTASRFTSGLVVHSTSDGGYFLLCEAAKLLADGYYWWDSLYASVDPSGNLRWHKQLGVDGYSDDVLVDAVQVPDGGFVCAGYRYYYEGSSWGEHAWMVKLDSAGRTRWQYAYGGPSEYFAGVSRTKDGGILATGRTWSFGKGGSDGWGLRLTATGKVKSQLTYGGTLYDSLISGRQSADGTFTLAGMTGSFSVGKYDLFFLRLPSDGYSCRQITGTSSAKAWKVSMGDSIPAVKSKRLVVSPRPSNCLAANTQCTITDACLTAADTQPPTAASNQHNDAPERLRFSPNGSGRCFGYPPVSRFLRQPPHRGGVEHKAAGRPVLDGWLGVLRDRRGCDPYDLVDGMPGKDP